MLAVTRLRCPWPGSRLSSSANSAIEPVQFALVGMNASMNHDLPLAVTATCAALDTTPDAGAHLADYLKVDRLAAAEQFVSQSFESAAELAIDRRLRAVCNLAATWTINSARHLASNNTVLLWSIRDGAAARQLVLDGLAASTAPASRQLLVQA